MHHAGIAFIATILSGLIVIALAGGGIVCGALKTTPGIRLESKQEFEGADLSIHRIFSTAQRESSW